MLLKYRPEDKAAKKERLLKKAQAEAEGKTVETKKPIVVKYGLNHVTYLIEQASLLIHHPQNPPSILLGFAFRATHDNNDLVASNLLVEKTFGRYIMLGSYVYGRFSLVPTIHFERKTSI